jgi:hypothetical protein
MKPSKNFWPLGIITAFGLFFAGMACVVGIAATHREHLVSPAYYEQELKFQNQIDAAARAKNAGATIRFDAAAGQIVIAVPPAQLAQKFSGTVTLYRAASPELDREFLLEPKNDGTQKLNVSHLAAGPWRMRAAWSAGEQNYFLEEQFVITAR